jgi:hypothetical protein
MTPLGLSLRNSGEWCSPFTRSITLLSKARPFSARHRRTRRDADDRQPWKSVSDAKSSSPPVGAADCSLFREAVATFAYRSSALFSLMLIGQ